MKSGERVLRELIREVTKGIGDPNPNRFAGGIPPALEPLAAEARKAPSYEEFKSDYMLQHKRGLYWHVTEDKHFTVDPNRGPQDKSAAGVGSVAVGGLMFTSYLEHWTDHYGKERPYAALLDLSDVDRNQYRQVSRGFGNEFYLGNAASSGIRVKKVVSIRAAKAMDRAYEKLLPKSYGELEQFYHAVVREPA